MSSITGREAVVGLKKAATWGTAVACGSDDGILILNESFKQTLEHLDDDSVGLPFIQRTDEGKIEVNGSLEAYMRYEGLDLPIALIMGAAGTPALASTSLAYSNSYTMSDNLSGLFATLAMLKKSDKVFEYPSVKFNKFTLAGDMNTPVRLTLEGIANKLDRASSTNTATTMSSVTYPDKGNRIIFNKDAHFWINDASGDALSSSDAVQPTSFELSFNRPMAADAFPGGDGSVNEPYEDGIPEITLTLKFPRYDDTNDAFFSAWEAYTEKKMEILFKGALIEDTSYYQLKLSFPKLKVVDPDAPISGSGKIPLELTFKVLGTDTAPTGMTGITKPFQIDVINTVSASPLA